MAGELKPDFNTRLGDKALAELVEQLISDLGEDARAAFLVKHGLSGEG